MAAAIAGAAIGNAATQPVQPPAVAVVPSTPAVVMGGPPAIVEEVIPAPQNGYHWARGHYELQNGVSTWVVGHWVADEVVIQTQ